MGECVESVSVWCEESRRYANDETHTYTHAHSHTQGSEHYNRNMPNDIFIHVVKDEEIKPKKK